jgi:ABC-2 type transport system ATP-binding protein
MLAKLQSLVPDVQQEDKDVLRLSSDDHERVTAVIDLVRGAKGRIVSVVPHKRTLEEVFVETVRKEDNTI